MALIEQIRRNASTAVERIDVTPLYAVIGMADKALETFREAGDEVETAFGTVRRQASPQALRRTAITQVGEVQSRAIKVAGQVQALPTVALSRGLGVVSKVTSDYSSFANRGEKVVTAVREQKATQELIEQVGSTVARTKGAVTTARHAVEKSEEQAATLFETATSQIGQVRSATKASATSARKTIAAAGKAATDAVDKTSATETPTPATKRSTPARRTSTTTRKAAAKKGAATRKAAATKTTATRKAAAKKAEATKAAADA